MLQNNVHCLHSMLKVYVPKAFQFFAVLIIDPFFSLIILCVTEFSHLLKGWEMKNTMLHQVKLKVLLEINFWAT